MKIKNLVNLVKEKVVSKTKEATSSRSLLASKVAQARLGLAVFIRFSLGLPGGLSQSFLR